MSECEVINDERSQLGYEDSMSCMLLYAKDKATQ